MPGPTPAADPVVRHSSRAVWVPDASATPLSLTEPPIRTSIVSDRVTPHKVGERLGSAARAALRRSPRDHLRALPGTERTKLLREAFPARGQARAHQAAASEPRAPTHDQLIALGFEGSCTSDRVEASRPGRQSTWRKYKASHQAVAILKALRRGRDGNTYAISELDGRRVTTLASPRLAELIGHQVEPPTPASMPTARFARSGSAR